jgi:hypothetical protein
MKSVASGRPAGRLFYWVVMAVILSMGLGDQMAAAGPVMTTINDTVYTATGEPATGTLIITWPAFTTSAGQPVAAGSTTVTLGAQGQLSVSLAANAGASPAGSYYTVVYQLSSGVNTQYWVVGTTSPTTIAAVVTTPGTSGPSQVASQQWVNGALTGKANDSAVVHNTGTETIAGTKSFAVNPSVPAPVAATDAANKAYVDTAVAAVSSGSYIQKSGDTMTGPLTLNGDPTAPLQAASRRYVDNGLAAKANLVNGTVPASQLGTGPANGATCLNGNSTWGPCGTSANAVQIQGVAVSTATPSDGQVITYDTASGSYIPKASAGGGGGLTAGMSAVKYATDFAWTQSPTADLSSPGLKTVTLSSCPAGVTGSEPWYYVYVSGTGAAEAVKVTGGTCAGDLGAGTLVFTTVNAHGAGYTVGSASGGLQEASIAARYTPSNPVGSSQAGKVIAPPGEIKLYARVSLRGSDQTVDFSGSIFECWMADSCIYVGEKSEIKRGVYDRLVSAAISVCVSAAIALHDHLGIR